MLFLIKHSLVRKKKLTVRFRDAAASSFVAKVQGEIFANFHPFAVKRHSNMLTGLFERILYEQSP
jgi:hypothetical protein